MENPHSKPIANQAKPAQSDIDHKLELMALEKLESKARFELIQQEIASRDKLVIAADTEIKRAWGAYEKLLSHIKIIFVCGTVLAAIIGFQGVTYILKAAKNEVNAELSQNDGIKKMIGDAASSTIAAWTQTNATLLGQIQVAALYANTRYETFNERETNRMTVTHLKDGNTECVFYLRGVPVMNSVEGTLQTYNAQGPLAAFAYQKNAVKCLIASSDYENFSFYNLKYVLDVGNTNSANLANGLDASSWKFSPSFTNGSVEFLQSSGGLLTNRLAIPSHYYPTFDQTN